MTDQPPETTKPPKKNRGAQPKKQATQPLQLTMPDRLHRYVLWLAANSNWGPTEQDVVIKILTREIDAMFVAGYHEKRHPGE